MRRVDVMSKSAALVTMISVVYALIDMKLIFLAPILTISIPYRFLRYKEDDKYVKNRKILNNLFLFNLIVFIGVCAVTNRISSDIFEIIANILITFVYFRILCAIEKKRVEIYSNPKKVYEKLSKKIDALEMIYKKTEENIENAKSEKEKTSMENKLGAIRYQIDELKRQLELVKSKIESKH